MDLVSVLYSSESLHYFTFCFNNFPTGAAGESRFGSSMTSLGDLNRDGYKDIAVGAPYEGKGAIYIYLGSQNGLIKEPAQVGF